MRHRRTGLRAILIVFALLAYVVAVQSAPAPDQTFFLKWHSADSVEALAAIGFTADGRSVWAVGGAGTILVTHDGGDHWDQQTSGTRNLLADLHISSDGRTGWVVGDKGTILATHNGGDRWEPQTSGTTNYLSKVQFSSDGRTGWAVGEEGTILITHNGGDRWDPQTSGTPNHLSGLQFSEDGRTGWAVGYQGTILVTHNGGDRWDPQTSGTTNYLSSVQFSSDGRTGWAVGDEGTILVTHDGGDRWDPQTSGTTNFLWSVQFSNDGRTGWVVGWNDTILVTHNGGERWDPQTSGSASHLFGAKFSADGHTGWAVGSGGTVLATRNGGELWNRRAGGILEGISSIQFSSDGRSGWAVSKSGTILVTHDGGHHWDRQTSGTENPLWSVRSSADGRTGWVVGSRGIILVTHNGGDHWDPQASGITNHLSSVHFSSDDRIGWVVGGNGTILVTHNGGDRWGPQTSGTTKFLASVQFSNAGRTGWAVGSRGTILATRNGGDQWDAQSFGTNQNLLGVQFSTEGHTGWVVGESGVMLRSDPPIFSPRVQNSKIESSDSLLGGEVEISFRVRADERAPVTAARLQARAGDRSAWNALGSAVHSGTVDDPWRLEWKPADYNIHSGDEVEYQVKFDDGGPTPPWIALGKIRYDPFWARVWRQYRMEIMVSAVPAGIVILYGATFVLILLVAPARLARVGRAAALDGVPAPTGNLAFVSNLIRGAFETIALPWMCRHPRVRRAWTREFRAGHASLRDLGKPARESFLTEPDVLDAWVEARIARVSDALEALELFKQREIYVEVPIRSGEPVRGQLIERPNPATLRAAFSRRRAVVAIVGPGGSGKSTLACAVARWAMDSRLEFRLTPHRMLPVFIAQDTTDLFTTVTRTLREMLGDEELPDDLVRGLLSRQRLLVIVDALSEREVATQQHVEKVFAESAAFNAMVITSRVVPKLGAVERTTLFPVRLDAKRIVPFIVDYLARLDDVAALQDGRVQLGLGDRILAIAEAGGEKTPVTPLLVTLFVQSAARRAAAGLPMDDMPHAIPEIFVDYLRRLNTEKSGDDAAVTDDTFIVGAQILGETSLGANLTPGDFTPRQATDALAAAGFGDQAENLLTRLVSSGVIERRQPGGITVLRFGLDPAAEYLAAIRQVFTLRPAGPQGFNDYTGKLEKSDGYPRGCDGYLAAFATCYRAYRANFGLPEMDFPWERE